MTTCADNELKQDHCILVVYPGSMDHAIERSQIVARFFGEIFHSPADLPAELSERPIFICGDLDGVSLSAPCSVIRELSTGYEAFIGASGDATRVISLGQVPHSVHGLGVYYPAYFEEADLFGKISAEHEFQQLTESNKPSQALRTGIYLSEVTPLEGDHGDDPALRFHLMRCSSNLSGPTDNFRRSDRLVITAINESAQQLFERAVSLNHVLAQIYTNRQGADNKQMKARIGAHSDKTKDMHPDGVMVFCTFYHEEELATLGRSEEDPYDRVYKKKVSGLTRLHFKLKKSVQAEGLIPEFSVTLYPNSALFIPLSTNRLYTHAIRPPVLNADLMPTRMGYVVRCSGTEAIHERGQTYIIEDDRRVLLADMESSEAQALRTTYLTENATDEHVSYRGIYFSMNAGDYMKPIY